MRPWTRPGRPLWPKRSPSRRVLLGWSEVSVAFGHTIDGRVAAAPTRWATLEAVPTSFTLFYQWGYGLGETTGEWAQASHMEAELDDLEALAPGCLPVLSWEPMGNRPDTDWQLADIIAGTYDTYITSWANALAARQQDVVMRFMHEQNANWYLWCPTHPTQGNTAQQYVDAWRHVHDIFEVAGANAYVQWEWSPVSDPQQSADVAKRSDPAQGVEHAPIANTWPGSAYVDIVSVSGYNHGFETGDTWQTWRSVAAIFEYEAVKLAAVAPGKPRWIAEIGSHEQGGDKAAWQQDTFLLLPGYGFERATWFDNDWSMNGQRNWLIDSTTTALAGWQAGIDGQLTVPAAPTLTATAASSTQIDVARTTVAHAASYVLEFSTAGATGPWTQLTATMAATHAHTGLTAASQVWYRALAKNAAGSSPWSTVATATTTTSLVEDTFTGTDGAAWHTRWTGIFHNQGAGTVDINANRGRVVTSAAGGYADQTEVRLTDIIGTPDHVISVDLVVGSANEQFVRVFGRAADANYTGNGYRLQLVVPGGGLGSATVQADRVDAYTATSLGTAKAMSLTVGDVIHLKMSFVESAVSLKAWHQSVTEPAGWDWTDTAAGQFLTNDRFGFNIVGGNAAVATTALFDNLVISAV